MLLRRLTTAIVEKVLRFSKTSTVFFETGSTIKVVPHNSNTATATIDSTELAVLDGVLATTAEINRACDVSTRVVNCTASTLAITELSHDNKLVTLNRAAGIAVTLPASTGSGAFLRFYVGTTVTSNSTTIKVANSSDIMAGNAIQAADAGSTSNMWETGASDDTITFNGTTTGGIKGDFVELIDVAANVWFVRVIGSATGTEATPFSATV